MTRNEYLNANVIYGFAAHRAYFAQFVTPRVMGLVRTTIGEDVIKHSTDFNDIPLRKWDNLETTLRPLCLRKVQEIGNDFWSMGMAICIAKEAARQIKDES